MGDKINIAKIVLATHNQHKLDEFRAYMQQYNLELVEPVQQLPDVEETGDTFEANALLKARAVAQATGMPALADDSGICVWALDGKPGIYSARWAGPKLDYLYAFNRVENELKKLGNEVDRSASFVCTLALCFPDEQQPAHIFEGRIDGTIIAAPQGPIRFGYDSVFIPSGHTRTFAEMTPMEKQAISHRTIALNKFFKAIA